MLRLKLRKNDLSEHVAKQQSLLTKKNLVIKTVGENKVDIRYSSKPNAMPIAILKPTQ